MVTTPESTIGLVKVAYELTDGSLSPSPVNTSNPLPVSVISGGGSNASVGTNASTAPTSSTQIGYTDGSGNLQAASDTNPLPVIWNAPRGTFTDRSGNITTGGTSQQLMAVNANRKYLIIVNPTVATENLYINFTSAATVAIAQATATSSIPIAPGGSYNLGFSEITTEAVNIIAATTAHAFIAKEG